MSIDLRNRLRETYGTPPSTPVETPRPDSAEPERERAFVVHAKSGRTVITGPVREIALANAGFTYLRGRFVEADAPNLNGAMWTSDDLELGQTTVAGGPLNWLHDDHQIIGSLLDGRLVKAAREGAAHQPSNHIETTAAVWRFLFPKQTNAIERAAKDNGLYFSMECISREVACIDAPGRPGCGESFGYEAYDKGEVCQHLRERSSVRRFVDPIFLGGAVIVPPVKPGWANAEAEVVRQAAALSEAEHLAGDALTDKQATELAAAVLQWANR